MDDASGGVGWQARNWFLSRRGRLLVGAALLAGLLLFVALRLDWRAVLAVAGRADPSLLGAAAAAALVGLACWSEALRHLLPPGAAPVGRRRGFLVYATGALVRNALPVGYASSVGVLAYLYRREASIPLDRSLAAVSVAEFVNVVASTAVAISGVLLLVTLGPVSPLVARLTAVALLLVVAGVAVAALLWHRREAVERFLQAVVSALSRVVDRVVDRQRAPLSPEAVERAIAGYVRSLSTVSNQRRAVAVSLGFAASAWASLVVSLYAAGLAIGYAVPIPIAALVIPVVGYAAVLPLPGGLGGYELGLAGALSVLGGAEVVVAVAVTLLFRLCSYWLVIAVGALASAALSVDLRRLAAAALGPDSPEPGADSSDR